MDKDKQCNQLGRWLTHLPQIVKQWDFYEVSHGQNHSTSACRVGTKSNFNNNIADRFSTCCTCNVGNWICSLKSISAQRQREKERKREKGGGECVMAIHSHMRPKL